MNKKLIVNADDFGYTPGVTQGIIEAHNKGIVTSTTAIPVSYYFMEAMEVARKTAPTLSIGVHLTLTLKGNKPILPKEEVPSLINEKGLFWHLKKFEKNISLDEVYKEWEAQIIEFLKSGRKPSHIDSHHNVHGRNEGLLEIALDLARKFNLPLRNTGNKNHLKLYKDVKTPDRMLSQFYGKNVTMNQFKDILKIINDTDQEMFEMNCHPAFIDIILQETSNYCMERIEELKILTSNEVKNAIKENNILLTNFEILK